MAAMQSYHVRMLKDILASRRQHYDLFLHKEEGLL